MSVFLLSFTIFAAAVLGMAVGILFGRRPLNAGSCGQRIAGQCGTGCGFCTEDGPRSDARGGPVRSAEER